MRWRVLVDRDPSDGPQETQLLAQPLWVLMLVEELVSLETVLVQRVEEIIAMAIGAALRKLEMEMRRVGV